MYSEFRFALPNGKNWSENGQWPTVISNSDFNAIYRTTVVRKSYTKGEISIIMWRDVICAHKPYFLMPGHNYYINVMTCNHAINLVNTPTILPWPRPCMWTIDNKYLSLNKVRSCQIKNHLLEINARVSIWINMVTSLVYCLSFMPICTGVSDPIGNWNRRRSPGRHHVCTIQLRFPVAFYIHDYRWLRWGRVWEQYKCC